MGILNPLPPLKAGETCTLSDEGHLKPSLTNITFSLIVSASVHFSQKMYSLGIKITRGVHKITIEFDLIWLIITLYEFYNHKLIIYTISKLLFSLTYY